MNKLYGSIYMNKLYFKYEGNSRDVNFYEFMDSKELFNKIKNNQIKFDDAVKKEKIFLNKLNNVKIGKKTSELKEVITNLENVYKSREDVFNFFKDYTKMMFASNSKAKHDKIEGTGLKILAPKQILQRLQIALAQVKAGTQRANIGPQDIPRTSPSNVPRTSPKDPI